MQAANPLIYAHGWWDCPIGCPPERQRVCDVKLVNADKRTQRGPQCLWDFPNQTGIQPPLAVFTCKQVCTHSGGEACPVSVYSQQLYTRCRNGQFETCDAPQNVDALLFGLKSFPSASEAARAGEFGAMSELLGGRLDEYKRKHRIVALLR